MKFARKATGRAGIVYCTHGFHGLSYGALSLNGDQVFREGFGPLLPDCVQIPFNDLEALERALAGRRMAAFVVEPIQGKGVNLPDDGYLAGARELCLPDGKAPLLFCQLICIPLLKDHRVLVQVAGHASHTVKLLPALVLNDEDCDWIKRSFETVIADSHRMPGGIWTLGKTLAEGTRKAMAHRYSYSRESNYHSS